MQESAHQTVVTILKEHFADDQYNVHSLNDVVSIQLYLLPDEFGPLATTLTEAGFTYKVSSGFEMPPKLTVQGRYWPDDVEDPVDH